jgi:hypothetical protein
VERRYNKTMHPHLRPLGTVDSVCTMGMMFGPTATISTSIQSSHSPPILRGLFCAQLLARVLHPLAKTTIA